MPGGAQAGLPESVLSTPREAPVRLTIRGMGKKTGMSDSSLWLITVVLVALTAWMYFRH